MYPVWRKLLGRKQFTSFAEFDAKVLVVRDIEAFADLPKLDFKGSGIQKFDAEQMSLAVQVNKCFRGKLNSTSYLIWFELHINGSGFSIDSYIHLGFTFLSSSPSQAAVTSTMYSLRSS